MTKRHKKMRGGFFESIGNTLSNWGTSISQGATNAWNKTKNAATSMSSTTTPSINTNYTTNTTPSYTVTNATGGKRRTNKQRTNKGRMSGGSQLAMNAAPISDIPTAKPHHWVGGKTRKRKHKHSKFCHH